MADFLKLLFCLLHAELLNLIDPLEHLPLEADQLGAGFAKAAIVVGPFFERLDLFVGRGDGLRLFLSSVGEDGADVQLALCASACWLSTSPLHGVEGARQQGRPVLELGKQRLDLFLGLVELCAEVAEFVFHGLPVAGVF